MTFTAQNCTPFYTTRVDSKHRKMAKVFVLVSILLVFILEETYACPTGCSCSETQITCTNLDTLPDAGELFTDSTDVESVSITESSSITQFPPDFFSDMPKLTTLSLTNNGLTSLNLDSFKYLPKLSTIDISGNPIDCEGSENDWIKTWLFAVDTSILIGTCSDGREFVEYTDFLPDVIPASLMFDNEVYTVDEGDTQTITVSRDGNTSDVLNVRVVVDLTDASEDDVVIQDKQLTFPVGESSVQFDLTIPDNTRKDPEAWGFTLNLVPESIIVRNSSAAVTLVDNDPFQTDPPVVISTSKSDTDPNAATSPGKVPAPEESSDGGSKVWIIIVVLIVLALAIIIGVFIWKKKQDRKRTTASPGQGDYSAVQGEGDGKVYSATTEELA